MSDVRAFDRNCLCEVIAPSVEAMRVASLAYPHLEQIRRTGFSYLRVKQDGSLVIVSTPRGDSVTEIPVTESGLGLRRLRAPEKWEQASDRYRKALDTLVHGTSEKDRYGRSRTFDKDFTVKVNAPHWVTLQVKSSGARVELRHGDRFSHLHPEFCSLEDSALPAEFKLALESAGFDSKRKFHLYYFETQGLRREDRDDKGWIVLDLERGRVAAWSAAARHTSSEPLTRSSENTSKPEVVIPALGQFPVVFEFPSPNR